MPQSWPAISQALTSVLHTPLRLLQIPKTPDSRQLELPHIVPNIAVIAGEEPAVQKEMKPKRPGAPWRWQYYRTRNA